MSDRRSRVPGARWWADRPGQTGQHRRVRAQRPRSGRRARGQRQAGPGSALMSAEHAPGGRPHWGFSTRQPGSQFSLTTSRPGSGLSTARCNRPGAEAVTLGSAPGNVASLLPGTTEEEDSRYPGRCGRHGSQRERSAFSWWRQRRGCLARWEQRHLVQVEGVIGEEGNALEHRQPRGPRSQTRLADWIQ